MEAFPKLDKSEGGQIVLEKFKLKILVLTHLDQLAKWTPPWKNIKAMDLSFQPAGTIQS